MTRIKNTARIPVRCVHCGNETVVVGVRSPCAHCGADLRADYYTTRTK